MASMTMTAPFLGGTTAIAHTKQPPAATSRRGLLVMANASKDAKTEESGRREIMVAVAAIAACSAAKIAMAEDEEPKRGTAAAKKKYGPVCVTMPTARICRN